MPNPIRVEHAKVVFFDGLTIDAYRLPSGEFRVGLADASRTLGFDREWLTDAIDSKTPRTAKSLRGLGFSEKIQEVSAQSTQGNFYDDRTITLGDFNTCIIYAVQRKKKAAIALSRAFTKLALIDFFKEAFGETPLTIDEKRKLFYEEYAKTISPDDWRTMDKQDIVRLALPGDEPHLVDGQWNSWIDEED